MFAIMQRPERAEFISPEQRSGVNVGPSMPGALKGQHIYPHK